MTREDRSTVDLFHVPCSFLHIIQQEDGKIKLYDPKNQIPVPKAYVKVFARSRGQSVVFFKDGYTDIRGQFYYSQLMLDNNEVIEKFAILVITPENGCTVLECNPPKRFAEQKVEEASLLDVGYL